jgi:hypothetical protein
VFGPEKVMNLRKTKSAPASLEQLLSAPDHAFTSIHNGQIQFFPPQAIEWNSLRLTLPRWPVALNGLRLLHLSDFHLRRRWPAVMDLVLLRMRENPPDLVLITGDFVDNKQNHRPAMPQVRKLVEGLRSRHGCFAIHGNHDSYKIGVELGGLGVKFLDGRRAVVELPGGRIELIGLPGKHRRELRESFLNSLPAREAGVPRIVLSHFPDHLTRTGGLDADLFLAGHTHGGQICLPDGRALIWHDGLPRNLSKGAHRIGDTWLVVSRGLGYTGIPLRMFSRPEVVEIVCCSGTGGPPVLRGTPRI